MRNEKRGRGWMFAVIVLSLLWAPAVMAQRQADNDRPQSRRARVAAEPEAPRGDEHSPRPLALEASVMPIVKFSGVLKDGAGRPRTGLVGLTIALYREQDGGAALWMESQNVEVDEQGRYMVLLGATKSDGLPMDLFTSGEARWVGVQAQMPGEAEQPRALLVSVPYAFKAKDAETLGGLPATAFLRATREDGEIPITPPTRPTTGKKGPTVDALTSGTVNYIAKFTSSTDLGNSAMYEDAGGKVGLGTTTPTGRFTVSTSTDVTALWVSNSSAISSTGIHATSSGTAGIAVRAEALTTSGATFGVFSNSMSTSGTGVRGDANAVSGTTYGVAGNTWSTAGTGVFGKSNTASGTTYGVRGLTLSSGFGAAGVRGEATATTGNAIGVYGSTANTLGLGAGVKGEGNFTAVWGVASSPNGIGVKAESTATTGAGSGVYAVSSSNSGRGVFGVATYPTGTNYGVYGSSFSSNGTGVRGTAPMTGVHGEATSPVGAAIGVRGTTASSLSNAAGVKGEATSTQGDTYGVLGVSSSTLNRNSGGSAAGVRGEGVTFGVQGSATGADSVGVHGQSPNYGVEGITTGGIGVRGESTATSGSAYGVYGSAASVSGAGVFGQADGGLAVIGRAETGVAGDFLRMTPVDEWGTILRARTAAGNRFKVLSNGNVLAGAAFIPFGADFAESVAPIGEKSAYEPGDVLVIGAEKTRSVERSGKPYATRVAGIYSTRPGVLASPFEMEDPRGGANIPMAVIGIVPCKVSAENGPIAIGDLLVTSSMRGHAMRGTKRGKMLGAIVGKAMQAFDPRDAKGKPNKKATGVIEVLVTLQ